MTGFLGLNFSEHHIEIVRKLKWTLCTTNLKPEVAYICYQIFYQQIMYEDNDYDHFLKNWSRKRVWDKGKTNASNYFLEDSW